MPFKALVEKYENFERTRWYTAGVWEGVQIVGFYTTFCTENLDTMKSNCPELEEMFPSEECKYFKLS